ncbi:hypothetical protein GUJ93_ZPchr0006g43250 [Zizania palustris]|uniref:Uncharacterized protein n=1 Tax=Zizania palustris TaxID=103762 RepID=A0A8J5TEA0_ZIZPA|nr:hypothetical protein GUJ93_ZPchr0006g43250 [Zizania palustris]
MALGVRDRDEPGGQEDDSARAAEDLAVLPGPVLLSLSPPSPPVRHLHRHFRADTDSRAALPPPTGPLATGEEAPGWGGIGRLIRFMIHWKE